MKVIVNRIVELSQRLREQIQTPPKLAEHEARIQEGFDSIPSLQQNDMLADYTRLITGFRPRLKLPPGRPFEAWFYGNSVKRIHLGICVVNNQTYGISDMVQNGLYYDAHCRRATDDEWGQMLDLVKTWNDAQLLNWVNTKLGSNYMAPFLQALEM